MMAGARPRGVAVSSAEPESLGAVLRWIVRHPVDALARRWNYKSAVMSSLVRSLLFFAANLAAGLDAATAAMATEFTVRFLTAGFYGALTQAFRRVEPAVAGLLAATVLLPLTAHSIELIAHWWRGTPRLASSLAVSVVFTVLSTSFNLFAMRRGLLIVGHGRKTLLEDLRAMPRAIAAFLGETARFCVRL